MLMIADGAPGLIKASEHCWPDSDRQHCAVHRVRNLLAKLPEQQRDRVRQVLEWIPSRGHVRALAVRPRKDGVRRAPNPTCVPAGVPA